MKTHTTSLNIIPLRAEPSHRSEQVTQVLFGEPLLLLETEGEFAKVQMTDTGYEGWVQSIQLVEREDVAEDAESYIVGLEPVFVSDGAKKSPLYHTTPILNRRLSFDGQFVEIEGALRKATLGDFISEFPQLVDHYLRTPYLWGGRSVAGIDCSGLSQVFLAHFGVQIKRDAYQQAESGVLVNFLAEAKAGDLAFFDNAQGRITHVGIMMDPETIIHAAGEVRIDRIDQHGIYHSGLQKYTHQLRIIKRYF